MLSPPSGPRNIPPVDAAQQERFDGDMGILQQQPNLDPRIQAFLYSYFSARKSGEPLVEAWDFAMEEMKQRCEDPLSAGQTSTFINEQLGAHFRSMHAMRTTEEKGLTLAQREETDEILRALGQRKDLPEEAVLFLETYTTGRTGGAKPEVAWRNALNAVKSHYSHNLTQLTLKLHALNMLLIATFRSAGRMAGLAEKIRPAWKQGHPELEEPERTPILRSAHRRTTPDENPADLETRKALAQEATEFLENHPYLRTQKTTTALTKYRTAAKRGSSRYHRAHFPLSRETKTFFEQKYKDSPAHHAAIHATYPKALWSIRSTEQMVTGKEMDMHLAVMTSHLAQISHPQMVEGQEIDAPATIYAHFFYELFFLLGRLKNFKNVSKLNGGNGLEGIEWDCVDIFDKNRHPELRIGVDGTPAMSKGLVRSKIMIHVNERWALYDIIKGAHQAIGHPERDPLDPQDRAQTLQELSRTRATANVREPDGEVRVEITDVMIQEVIPELFARADVLFSAIKPPIPPTPPDDPDDPDDPEPPEEEPPQTTPITPDEILQWATTDCRISRNRLKERRRTLRAQTQRAQAACQDANVPAGSITAAVKIGHNSACQAIQKVVLARHVPNQAHSSNLNCRAFIDVNVRGESRRLVADIDAAGNLTLQVSVSGSRQSSAQRRALEHLQLYLEVIIAEGWKDILVTNPAPAEIKGPSTRVTSPVDGNPPRPPRPTSGASSVYQPRTRSIARLPNPDAPPSASPEHVSHETLITQKREALQKLLSQTTPITREDLVASGLAVAIREPLKGETPPNLREKSVDPRGYKKRLRETTVPVTIQDMDEQVAALETMRTDPTNTIIREQTYIIISADCARETIYGQRSSKDTHLPGKTVILTQGNPGPLSRRKRAHLKTEHGIELREGLEEVLSTLGVTIPGDVQHVIILTRDELTGKMETLKQGTCIPIMDLLELREGTLQIDEGVFPGTLEHIQDPARQIRIEHESPEEGDAEGTPPKIVKAIHVVFSNVRRRIGYVESEMKTVAELLKTSAEATE